MKFEKGISGNISGRPRGIKDRRTLFAEILDVHKTALFDKALELALEGNEQLLKLFLERLLPAKPKDNPIVIENFEGTLSEQANKIMQLMSDGIISIEEAQRLFSLLTAKVGFVDLIALNERLKALEENLKTRGITYEKFRETKQIL